MLDCRRSRGSRLVGMVNRWETGRWRRRLGGDTTTRANYLAFKESIRPARTYSGAVGPQITDLRLAILAYLTRVICRWCATQPERICFADRVSADIGIRIDPSSEPDRVFGDEPTPSRIVIPGSVVVQLGTVVLPSRILVAVVIRRAGDAAVAVGVVAVAGLDRAGVIYQRHRRAQVIGQIG